MCLQKAVSVRCCTAALLHWCIGASMHWHVGALVRWCTGTSVYYHVGPLVHRHVGTCRRLGAKVSPPGVGVSCCRGDGGVGGQEQAIELQPALSPARFLEFPMGSG